MTTEALQIIALFAIFFLVIIALETNLISDAIYWSNRLFIALFALAFLCSFAILILGGAWLVLRAML